MSDIAAVFDSVSKKFVRSITRPRSFQEGFLRLFNPRRERDDDPESFYALRDISFEVERGSMLGIIGSNGSGKSTVLKLLTRILEPTSGTIQIDGRVAALLELGAGFHPELTGRENIYMMGSLHGLSQREMGERLESVIEFSGLHEFIDVPVKHYSSGMYMRLGFSTMIHLEADILLVDEILAVGDQMFQRKCLSKIADLRRNDKTILFVSHDLSTVRELCNRVIWIDNGLIRADGLPREVTSRYLLGSEEAEIHSRSEAAAEPEPEPESESEPEPESKPGTVPEIIVSDPRGPSRWGNRQVEITQVRLLDGQGRALSYIRTGNAVCIAIDYRMNQPTEDVVFGIGIFRQDGLCCYGTNSTIESIPLSGLSQQGRLTLASDNLWLLDGEYTLDVAIHSRDERPYDYWRSCLSFSVRSLKQDVGVFRPPLEWTLNGSTLAPDEGGTGEL